MNHNKTDSKQSTKPNSAMREHKALQPSRREPSTSSGNNYTGKPLTNSGKNYIGRDSANKRAVPAVRKSGNPVAKGRAIKDPVESLVFIKRVIGQAMGKPGSKGYKALRQMEQSVNDGIDDAMGELDHLEEKQYESEEEDVVDRKLYSGPPDEKSEQDDVKSGGGGPSDSVVIDIPEEPYEDEIKDYFVAIDIPTLIESESAHTLRQMIKLHFIKMGRGPKSIASFMARAELAMKTTGFDKDHHDRVTEMVKIVREEYERTEPVLDWRTNLRVWFKDLQTVSNFLKLLLLLTSLVTILCFVLDKSVLWSLLFGLVVLICQRMYKRYMAGGSYHYPVLRDVCLEMVTIPEHTGVVHDTDTQVCVEREYPVGFSIALDSVTVPRACSHNELRAVIKRQCLPPISTNPVRKSAWRRGFKALMQSFLAEDLAPFNKEVDVDAWLCRYPKAQRNKLRNTYERLCLDADYIKTRRKCFVKVEALCGKEFGECDPRLISASEDEYLVELGPEYYKFQKEICAQHYSTLEQALKEKFIYTGGMNAETIGAIISHYELLDYHIYEGDYSRYDGHTECEAIEEEVEFYKNYLGPSSIRLLQSLYKTRGMTSHGVRFTVDGKFPSGNPNTSFGNTLRGFAIFAGIMDDMDVTDYVVIQLGDDNILLTKQSLDVEEVVLRAADYGHKLVMIDRMRDYDKLEFCSGIFWDLGPQRVLGPKIGKVGTKGFVPLKRLQVPLQQHVAGVVESYRHYAFLPMIATWIKQYDRLAVKSRPIYVNEYKAKYGGGIQVDTSCVARQFERIYGVSVDSVNQVAESIDWTVMGMWHSDNILRHLAQVDGAAIYGRSFGT
jgi:hypothetical protein